MQYLLSVHDDPTRPLPSPDVMEQMYKDVDAVNVQIKDAGIWVFAGGLQPADTATTVRNKDGDISTTDGPYAEVKEHIGGFWIIDVDNLDKALEWAKKGSVACRGDVEVRPFQPEPGQ
jgi:hypothetical protein